MTGLSAALHALEDIVGAEHLLTATDSVSQYRLDGQQPAAVALPASPEELAQVLKAASGARMSVLLRGAGRHLHLGAPPSPIALVICLTRLNRIVEYDPEDLALTAQAGVRLRPLQAAARERNRMLPLDPPGGDDATLGGIVATNQCGPLQMGYGSPRDRVLRMRAALPDGSLVNAGGKAAEHAAARRLGKLLVGSLGTVGVICEVTLRLAPRPEAEAAFIVSLPRPQALALTATVAHSRLQPTTLEVANYEAMRAMRLSLPVTVQEGLWVVFVGAMGERETVTRQHAHLGSLVPSGLGRLEGEEAERAWTALREAPYPREAGAVVARAAVPLSAVAAVVEHVAEWDGWWALARSGQGVVYAGPLAGTEVPQVVDRLRELRTLSEGAGGFVVLESGPTDLKRAFPVWGDENPNLDLMRRLRQTFDGEGLMGAGRYVAGL